MALPATPQGAASNDGVHPNIDSQRQFWDGHWQYWQPLNKWSARRTEVVLGLLASLGLDAPRILDLGCGSGWFSERLAVFGPTTGVDLSEQAIAMARVRCPQVTFLTGDIYRMPLPAGASDVVVSQEVLSHVQDQPGYVSVAARVLRDGGYLILTTDNKYVMDRLGPRDWVPQPPEHIEQFLDMRSLKRLLRPQFRVLRATTLTPIGSGGVLRIVNSTKLNRLVGRVVPPRYLTAAKEKAGFGYKLVVLAQKRPAAGRG